MLISAIIPAYNMAQYLPDALNSIIRQKQKVGDVIIVNPSSQDNTEEVVDSFKDKLRINYIKTSKCSPSVARNLALKQATGQYITFLDADDVWPSDKLEVQVGKLEQNTNLDMISGFIRYFETLDPISLSPKIGSRTSTSLNVNVGACIYRANVFDKIGLFNEDLHYCEDVDLLERVRQWGIPFLILREVVLYYRKHNASMIHQKDDRKSTDFAKIHTLTQRRIADGQFKVRYPKSFKHHLEPLRRNIQE